VRRKKTLKFLRKIRKGFRTACLTAALTTCWQIGQVAKAEITPMYHEAVTFQFSGTVTPTQNNISHLFLIFGTGYSSLEFGPWTVKLGDFPAGQSNIFSKQLNATFGESAYWVIAGLYGDISSGHYIDGVNGVVMGTISQEGDSWGWYNSPSEADAFNQLLNDAPGNGFSYLLKGSMRHGGWYGYGWSEFTESCVLYNFSNASPNGQIQINAQVIPEPVSIVLFGGGGIFVVAFRSQKK
jgi:hypothetical protein